MGGLRCRDGILFETPLRIQRDDLSSGGGEVHDRLLVRVRCSGSDFAGVPADESVAVVGEGVLRKVLLHVEREQLILHGTHAAVGVESDGVVVRSESRDDGDVSVRAGRDDEVASGSVDMRLLTFLFHGDRIGDQSVSLVGDRAQGHLDVLTFDRVRFGKDAGLSVLGVGHGDLIGVGLPLGEERDTEVLLAVDRVSDRVLGSAAVGHRVPGLERVAAPMESACRSGGAGALDEDRLHRAVSAVGVEGKIESDQIPDGILTGHEHKKRSKHCKNKNKAFLHSLPP